MHVEGASALCEGPTRFAMCIVWSQRCAEPVHLLRPHPCMLHVTQLLANSTGPVANKCAQ